MPTAREQGVALLATVVLGAVALANFNSNDTTKALSNTRTKLTQPFAPAKVELKENEKDALVHSLLDQQGFLHKYTDIVPISQMAGNLAQPVHLPDADKSAVMLQNNCWLNQLSEQLESSLTNYTDKKGDVFVDGPVTKWTSAYANAAGDVGLQDTDYLMVASAKARFDGMMFYIKISHTVETCAYKKNAENDKTVVADPALFMPLTEAMCDKSKAAKLDFERGAGRALIVEGAAIPECDYPTRNTQLQLLPTVCKPALMPDSPFEGSCPTIDTGGCPTNFKFVCQAFEFIDHINRVINCPAMKKAKQEKCKAAEKPAEFMKMLSGLVQKSLADECKGMIAKSNMDLETYRAWKEANPTNSTADYTAYKFASDENLAAVCTEYPTNDTPYPVENSCTFKSEDKTGFRYMGKDFDYCGAVGAINPMIQQVIDQCNV